MSIRKKVILYHLHFTISVIMIVICFPKIFVDKKNDKVAIDFIPETNEEYITVIYGCTRYINSYRCLSMGLDELVKKH